MTSTDRQRQRRVFAVDQSPGGSLLRYGQLAEISRAADAALARRGLGKKKYDPNEGIYRKKKSGLHKGRCDGTQ